MAKKSLQDINPLEYDLSTNVSVSPKQQTDRLIQLGKGVYKDKISGKLLYNYDEMPTAEVVGHKKEKSINDNLQKAYAKGIPSGTMASDMETMNAVTGGALNWTMPSQLIGATGRLINDGDFGQFGRNLILGNSGIVTDNFHKEHPYWSLGANVLFDTATLGLASVGKTGIKKGIDKITLKDNIYANNRLYSNNPYVNLYATYARRFGLPDKARLPYLIRRVKSDELPFIEDGNIQLNGPRFKHTNFTYDRPVISHNKGKWDSAQQTYIINGRNLIKVNKGNWGSIEPSDMFTIKDPENGLMIPQEDVTLISGNKDILYKANNIGLRNITNDGLQIIEGAISPRGKIGRFDFSGGERRGFNTPYWKAVNNTIKRFGVPKYKDIKLLEKTTGLDAGVTRLNKDALNIIDKARIFEKLNLDDAAEVMKLKYPNGRNIDFIKDRDRYNVSGFPYNNVFYDPTTYAESLFDFSKYQH